MTVEAHVLIPGEMVATYKNGEITEWTWSPRASDAGYFGPAAVLHEWWKPTEPVVLDILSTDGSFWRAVQESIADSKFTPEWTE